MQGNGLRLGTFKYGLRHFNFADVEDDPIKFGLVASLNQLRGVRRDIR